MMIAIIMAAFFIIFIFEAQTTKGPGMTPGPFCRGSVRCV
jgi:hypothetical protein